MSERNHLAQAAPLRGLVAVVLGLVLLGTTVSACGGGAAVGAIVGAATGAAIGSSFDDPHGGGCCADDPYFYATDPVAHDDTW